MEGFLTAAAGVIALMVAILTTLKLLSENFEKMLAAYSRWRDKRNRPRYILMPTLEELAKYSVKEPDRQYPSKKDIEKLETEKMQRSLDVRKKIRILLVWTMFAIMFASIGVRLLYLGLLSSISE